MLLTMLLTACEADKVYDTFQHVDNNGWEKNDGLTFAIPRLTDSGRYDLSLRLRLGSEYPFQNLHIAVTQTVYPSGKTATDIVKADITDKQGKMKGNGVTLYQYSIPFRTMDCNAGDSVTVKVRHDMKREILPGIMDVGVAMYRR